MPADPVRGRRWTDHHGNHARPRWPVPVIEGTVMHSYLHYVFSLVWVLVPKTNTESASGPAA